MQTENEHLFECNALENQIFPLSVVSHPERADNESILDPIHTADSYLL